MRPQPDERRDRWRPLFRARLAPLVADARSLTEAALQLNARAWGLWGIEFRADSTPAVLSPFQARPPQQAQAVTLCGGACPLRGSLVDSPDTCSNPCACRRPASCSPALGLVLEQLHRALSSV